MISRVASLMFGRAWVYLVSWFAANPQCTELLLGLLLVPLELLLELPLLLLLLPLRRRAGSRASSGSSSAGSGSVCAKCSGGVVSPPRLWPKAGISCCTSAATSSSQRWRLAARLSSQT